MLKELNYTKVLSEDSSFQLVRTNPKLTGNIKIAVNESGNLWMNAIPVNLELSKEDYSKVAIDVNKSLASNIYRFFKNGQTPKEIVFELSERVDLTKTSKDFKDQYDFSYYFSGIKYFPSKKYDETLSYFAPLYLKKEVPNYFVIFKIKDPINAPIDELKNNFESGQSREDYLIELFKKATIIKTFDLTPESKVGAFIRNYINDPGFPVSPLSVSFEKDQYTKWNGISLESGVLGGKGELLYDQYVSSTPLKFFEETITRGYERNGIIFPNILNFEFIFNDDSSENYEFNRYLGLYVNSIELSKLDIDLKRAYDERGTWPNTPRLRKEYLESDETILTQSNPDGVLIPYKNLDFNITEFKEIFSNSESFYFNYLTDRYGKLHLPKLDQPYSIDYSPEILVSLSISGSTVTVTCFEHDYSTGDLIKIESSETGYVGEYLITVIDSTTFTYELATSPILPVADGRSSKDIGFGKITMSDAKLDLASFFGPSEELFLQDQTMLSFEPSFSHAVIKLNSNLNHLDEIKIYHINGTRQDANGRYDLLTATLNYNLVPDPADYYYFNDYDGVAGFDTFYFNAGGQLSEVTRAIAGCINNIRNRSFSAYFLDEYLFIKCNTAGDFDKLVKVAFYSLTSNYSTITINEETSSNLIGKLFEFRGGDKFIGNKLVVDREHLAKLSSNLSNLLVKTKSGWSTIKKLSSYADLVDEDTYSKPTKKEEAILGYNNKILVILGENEVPTASYGEFIMRKKFRPAFGLLSLFPIKDLDFDFYASEYLNFPEIDLYQHYYIPNEVFLLESGIDYRVINGSISVTDGVSSVTYSENSSFSVTALSKYSIISGEPIVTFHSDLSSLGSSLVYPILDENKELNNFPGFSILKDPDKVVTQQNTEFYNLKTKYLNGVTNTEYDFYKENDAIDFATRSKVIPYITKWRIKNGTDSRDNPYRLNTEIVFGRNNFSPDHTSRGQNPDTFTHEWFYIESRFNYLLDESTAKLNSTYFDIPLDVTKLLSDPNYFIEYFTYTPNFGTNSYGEPIDVAPTQFRYSDIFKNKAGQYETFIKGFKLLFKDVTDPNVIGADGKPLAKIDTSRFEGYKFSCILKTVKEDIRDFKKPPIKYKCIEHKDHKWMVLIIELYIGAIDQISDYWKESPGSSGPLANFTKINNRSTNNVLDLSPLTIDDNIFYADPTFTLEFGTDLPFQTVNGDYRFNFEQIDGMDISNLTHSLLYSLKSKKFNVISDNYSNIKLSSKLNITSTGVNYADNTIDQLIVPQISNYPSFLSDEIIVPTDKTIVTIYNNITDTYLFIDQDTFAPPAAPININPISSALEKIAIFSIPPADSVITSTPISSVPYVGYFSPLPLSSGILSFIKNNYCFSISLGGEKYFEKLFEKLSFSTFKRYVNELNPIIEYYSYSLDQNGVSQLETLPNFYLEIVEPSEVSKKSQVITQLEEDRPSQYSFRTQIGYNYEVANLNNTLDLNRYRGEYEPITKSVLHCTSNFNFNKNLIENLKLSNTKLNSKILNLLTVQNFNHIKVSDIKILDLESDDAYSPVYPLIDEVAIGRANYFLLNSNWDWGFHHKYSTKSLFSPVPGTLRVEEDDCFLSKIVKLPTTIELDALPVNPEFEILTLSTNQKLEDVDLSQIEMAIKDNQRSLEGYINVGNILTRYLIEDGISAKFNEYLVNSNEYIGNFNSIEEYVKRYIKLNILKLYSIDTNEFFLKRNATLVSTDELLVENAIEFTFLNDAQRFDQQYELIKTVQINNIDQLILKFSIQKRLDAGFNISPKIKIKFT